MMKSITKIIRNRKEGKFSKVLSTIKCSKVGIKVSALLLTVGMFSTSVYALPADGGAMTDQLINEVLTWVQRIGAIMTVCAMLSFALAWKSDDSEAKSRATQFFIASAIVLSIKTILGVMGIV